MFGTHSESTSEARETPGTASARQTEEHRGKEKQKTSSPTLLKSHALQSTIPLEEAVEMVTRCNSNIPPLFLVKVVIKQKTFTFEPSLSSFR